MKEEDFIAVLKECMIVNFDESSKYFIAFNKAAVSQSDALAIHKALLSIGVTSIVIRCSDVNDAVRVIEMRP